MNQPPELLGQEECEHDGWPFTIRSFKTADGYFVQSFLRNMPVSHTYAVDEETYQDQKRATGSDPIAALVDIARGDLRNGTYRQWILHWASQ